MFIFIFPPSFALTSQQRAEVVALLADTDRNDHSACLVFWRLLLSLQGSDLETPKFCLGQLSSVSSFETALY